MFTSEMEWVEWVWASLQQNYVFREEMNLYRIVLASLLPFCQAWRVEVEPFENIPMYSKQNLTFKLEMENGM